MESFELSIVINRPIEEVFGFLSNLENDIKWRSEWVETRKTTEAPISKGTRYSLFAKAFGKRIETVYETIQYEPNQSAAWKIVSGPIPMTFWRIFERVEGGTRLTIRYEAELRGFFKVVVPLLAGSVKRQHEGDLRKVKEMLETGALQAVAPTVISQLP